jgi:hypothetical protein
VTGLGHKGEPAIDIMKMGDLVTLAWVTLPYTEAKGVTLHLDEGDPRCPENFSSTLLRLRFKILIEISIEIAYGQIINS